MSKDKLPPLPDYKKLNEFLETERKTIIKVNAFSEDDDLVRSLHKARNVLGFFQTIQEKLWKLFEKNPAFIVIFNNEYMSFTEFLSRDYILEICFLYDYIFPEKELLYLGEGENISEEVLQDHIATITDWIEETTRNHDNTQKFITDNFDEKIKIREIECQCTACLADYRTKLREKIYQRCIDLLDETKKKIEEKISLDINVVSDIFQKMQRTLDKQFFALRYRLKRSSLNKLEREIKKEIINKFTYPSELALKRTDQLKQFFASCLKKDGIRSDLVDELGYKKFFSQLTRNIWRNDRYLEREFQKQVRSVLMLKRKDISAKILKDYLGEFWLHTHARTLKRKIIYHMGPTNSGKTYFAIEALCKAKKGCYLAPLRLLAAELYDTMNSKGVVTTLLTGEEVIEIKGATHYSSTIEMARFQENFDCAVIDEIQMISDPQRGWAWTRAFVNIFAPEVHICGDPSALDLVKQIVEFCGDTLEIKKYERMTKLEIEKKPIVLGELERSDALIVFSRRNALKYKQALEQQGFKVSIVYGRLGPEVRREQARKFDQGETDIMVATDAIAMGMNLPIRRIVFSTLSKYIDSQEYRITKSEIKQISGRCGRYGRYPVGYVTCLAREEEGIIEINEAMKSKLPQKEKCMVGPDLDIFKQVNSALTTNGLPVLKLSEFLRLFNTMEFKKPFFCVELKEMIEVAEMVEEADPKNVLSTSEVFGFACAPVDLGMIDHVHYFVWILNHFVSGDGIKNEPVDYDSDNIDYLETSIKCVELYQWLARHFNNKHFDFNEYDLLNNKGMAIEKLNFLLSDKIVPRCSSCGGKLEEGSPYAICEKCFKSRRYLHNRKSYKKNKNSSKKISKKGSKKKITKKSKSGKRKYRGRRKRN